MTSESSPVPEAPPPRPQAAQVVLSPTSGAYTGRPGERVKINLTITNTGNSVDTIDTVFVDSLGWIAKLYGSYAALQPAESVPTSISVLIPRAAKPNTRDGISVTVASQFDPTVKAVGTYTITCKKR